MKILVWVMLLPLVLSGCDKSEPVTEQPTARMETVSGTVEFVERIGLTPQSRLEIRLLDVTLADAPAREIASKNIEQPGQSPLSFSLDYDPTLIDPDSTYSVSAKVYDRNKLILVSDTINPVLTGGNGSEVRVRVVRVSAATNTG